MNTGHECRCGESFSRKSNLKRHISRNPETCLMRYTEDEIERVHRCSRSSMMSPTQGPATPAAGAARRVDPAPLPPTPLPPPAARLPSIPSTHSPQQAQKRARLSADGDGAQGGDDNDPGGGELDEMYFSGEERLSGEDQNSDGEDRLGGDGGGHRSTRGDLSAGRASRVAQQGEGVLLYDVMRSKRIGELLKSFEDKAPYKPVEVRVRGWVVALGIATATTPAVSSSVQVVLPSVAGALGVRPGVLELEGVEGAVGRLRGPKFFL